MKKRFKEMGKNEYRPVEERAVKFISVPLARALNRVRFITPTRIQAFRVLFALLTAWLIVQREFAVSAFFVYFSFVLDKLDGDLARLRNVCSNKGAFIDSVTDSYTFMMFTIAAAITAGTTDIVLISLAVTSPLMFYYNYFGRAIHLDNGVRKVKRAMSNLSFRTVFAFSYGKLLLVLAACLLLNALSFYVYLLAVLQVYVVIWVLFYLTR